jgi:hypothetical protein
MYNSISLNVGLVNNCLKSMDEGEEVNKVDTALIRFPNSNGIATFK